jgi:hypothetical protein
MLARLSGARSPAGPPAGGSPLQDPHGPAGTSCSPTSLPHPACVLTFFKSASCRLFFSYEVLTPAALTFFVSYADGAVESLWSIDQYFEFVLVLMLSTGLAFQVGGSWGVKEAGVACHGIFNGARALPGRLGGRCCRQGGISFYLVILFGMRPATPFDTVHRGVVRLIHLSRQAVLPPKRYCHPCRMRAQAAPPAMPPTVPSPCCLPQVPVIQVMLGQLGIVSSTTMFAQWRYVVVGATIAAAVLTPSTDPFTQTLLAVPLVGLYLGGAGVVRLIEQRREATA